MFKFGLGYVAKLPRMVISLSLFITSVLLVFLFLCCIDNAPAFEGAYLIKFQYDPDSALYKDVVENGSYKDHKDLAKMQLQAGFISICGSIAGNDTKCTPRHDTAPLKHLKPLQVKIDDKNTSIDPLKLASHFASKTVNPYFLILTLVFVLVSFFSTLWTASAALPKQELVTKVMYVSTLLAWIAWTVGAIWLEVACNSVSDLVSASSGGVLEAVKGSRACGMAWACFSFLTLCLLMNLVIRVKMRKALAEPKVV